MSKILVVFTGGTIGSSRKNGWISPDGDTKRVIISNYQEITGDCETEFIQVNPYTTLSEYLSAKEFNLLSDCIFDNIDKGYDGIIVTHGTDTLQYTASALSYMLSETNIPIVLVSSAYPLEDARANGIINFIGAVEFVKAGAGTGVFVSYKNDNEEKTNIHIGTRLIAHRESGADVFSIDGKPYAFYDNKDIILNKAFNKSETDMGTGKFDFADYPDILMIESRPGDRYEYNLDNVKAVILAPYHSATINTKEKRLARLCEEAKKRDIPVFLVNARDVIGYESTKVYDNMGIEVLPLCGKIAIYIKCWVAVSKKYSVREFVKKPIAQEFCK